MPLTFMFTKQISPAFPSLIPKKISEMSLLTLFQSVKLLMLRYMVTSSALKLDDHDTTTNDVVAICLYLAVLQYYLRSITGTFTGMESSIQVSLIAK
ncbi:hypothetical protein TNCT_707151 [Trichonephila clavata]|uniref:Uncharacterized protein n=1 Tax=Trichonephila clavata TaxID=2740835 RepID=A0A8X6M3P8_TRICU|nr:hypothetical protein TNCT_707151 [Trichonephila clavata]